MDKHIYTVNIPLEDYNKLTVRQSQLELEFTQELQFNSKSGRSRS